MVALFRACGVVSEHLCALFFPGCLVALSLRIVLKYGHIYPNYISHTCHEGEKRKLAGSPPETVWGRCNKKDRISELSPSVTNYPAWFSRLIIIRAVQTSPHNQHSRQDNDTPHSILLRYIALGTHQSILSFPISVTRWFSWDSWNF